MIKQNYDFFNFHRQLIAQDLLDTDFDYIDSVGIEDLAKTKHLQIDHGMYGCAPSHFSGYFNKKKEEREL